MTFILELSYFNWRFKMFEMLLERCEVELAARKYLVKGVNSVDATLKMVRLNISKDLTMDVL